MITDGLPPHDRGRLGHRSDLTVDGGGVDSFHELVLDPAIPAFHQVDDVEDDDEGDRNVDVAVLARLEAVAGVARPGEGRMVLAEVVEVGGEGQLAPGDGRDAGDEEHSESEALPVGLGAEDAVEGLVHRVLL